MSDVVLCGKNDLVPRSRLRIRLWAGIYPRRPIYNRGAGLIETKSLADIETLAETEADA